MGPKRSRDGAMKEEKFEKPEQAPSPFMAMFEGFRAELDEHHDRRERIIKASRDITAASKKMWVDITMMTCIFNDLSHSIFTLQRVRALGQSVPPFVVKGNAPYWETIEKQYHHIAADVQGLNAFRYPQITGGNQEFMEALSFHHYLETQTLISYDDAKARVASMSGEAGAVLLTPEDYILGIFDMVGELMRFSITAMATNGKLPAGKPKKEVKATKEEESEGQDADKMDVDEQTPAGEPRNVLSDLRALRLQLEIFEPGGGKFAGDVGKKADVMRECVDKVEKALYQLTVRGTERPKGWVPGVREERRAEVESY